jgi:Arc/MetJ-type ribon-helix-helix transcriptional regulator
MPIPVNVAFLRELDSALKAIHVSNRSEFVRQAILEKLSREGRSIKADLAKAPSRQGKGGRRPKAKAKAKSAKKKR